MARLLLRLIPAMAAANLAALFNTADALIAAPRP
jgi:hypothetical protein